MLAAHGFTARDYVIASLTTARTAMMARMSAGAATPNVAFYRAHQAQIDKMMDLDAGDTAPSADKIEDLQGLNAKKLGECTKVAMGPTYLMPLTMRGTANTGPKLPVSVADALTDLASKVGEQNLRNDFRDIADELRRQAGAPQFNPTPRVTQALDDVKNWLSTNCSKEGLKR